MGDIGPELAHYDVLPVVELHLGTAPRHRATARDEEATDLAAGPGATRPAEPVVTR